MLTFVCSVFLDNRLRNKGREYPFISKSLRQKFLQQDIQAIGDLLTIERDGKEEHYRVEFMSDRYVVLYDLDEVEVEPDDYTIRIELEKM